MAASKRAFLLGKGTRRLVGDSWTWTAGSLKSSPFSGRKSAVSKVSSGIHARNQHNWASPNGPSMRVLFATANHTHLPQGGGGSEISTHDLCLALGNMGVETGVLCRIASRGVVGFRNCLTRRLLSRTKFPVDHVMGYPAFRGWDPETGVAEVVSRFRPSAAVIHPGRQVPLSNAFLAAGVPIILYLRDVLFGQIGGDLRPHPQLLYVANSRFVASRAKAVFGIEAHVLPPLVLPDRYRTATTRKKAVLIGLYPKKGVDLVFHMAEARPDIPFEVVESWRINKEAIILLQARARAAGNVRVRRWVADIRSVYREAKVVLVPSMFEEGWGRVVTEAHINGIPVLASNRGALPDSVGSGGILVDANAPLDEWTRALGRIWDNRTEYDYLASTALNYAGRSEIQPLNIATSFLKLVTEHIAACVPTASPV